MPRLRGMEHAERGSACDGVLPKARFVERGAGGRVRRARQAGRSAGSAIDGARRVRPCVGRRAGAGIGDSDGRRSGDREIDAAVAGCRRQRARWATMRLRQWRGSDRAGAHARHSPRAGGCSGETGFHHERAGYPDHAGRHGGTRPACDRFHPDHAFRHDRRRARHGQPGARLCVRTDPICQGKRCRPGPRGPCHQGWQHCWPACSRTHGRRGDELRRRAQPSISHPARAEEPFRRSGRDRRVLDGAGGAGRGRESLHAVPVGATGAVGGQRGVPRDRGDAARSGRDSGADRPAAIGRHTPPRGGGMGQWPHGDAAGRTGSALWAEFQFSGSLS